MFHDAVKRDDVTVGIDIEQGVSNTVKNSTEKVESISSHNCREYVDNNNCDTPQNWKAAATGRQLCRLLPRTELNPTH